MRRRTTIPLAVLVLLGAFHAFGSARAQAPARESNPDTITAVIPAFISEPPQLGMSITTILQLYIWKTLRLRSEKNRDVTFGNGKVLWDDVPPDEPTHAAAAETAIPDSAQMVLWGKAYPLPGGASVLSYLTLPAKPDRRVRQFEKWKLTFRIGDKSHEIVADVPTRQYAFEPISISDRLVDAYSRLEALSIYKTKTGNTTIGKVASTSSLFAMQWEEQAVQVKSGGKVGWLRLPHLSTTTELTAFVGGIIRIFRSDWEGAIELLSQVVYNSNTPTALRIDSNLLMARAAYQIGGDHQRYLLEAETLGPFSNQVVRYRVMGMLAELQNASNDRLSSKVVATKEYLDARAHLFPEEDQWLVACRDLLGSLAKQ